MKSAFVNDIENNSMCLYIYIKEKNNNNKTQDVIRENKANITKAFFQIL